MKKLKLGEINRSALGIDKPAGTGTHQKALGENLQEDKINRIPERSEQMDIDN